MKKAEVVFVDKDIPKPTGPYQVGMQKFDLYDEYRKDSIYKNGRLIPIQIYFPMSQGNHIKTLKILEKRSPQCFSHILHHVYSSEKDLKNINNEKHSIIIFTPGFATAMTDYATIMEDLASNGYIVITIQHQLYTDPLYTDPKKEPPFWKNHSIGLHSMAIDNLLYVFNWTQLNQENIFKNNINCQKVGFIGHSMGANVLFLLSSRSRSFGNNKKTLLPYHSKQNPKECIIAFDYNFSFNYPKSSQYPILFMVSEERYNLFKDIGIYEELENSGHKVTYYEPSQHISFLYQSYINPYDPCAPEACYFKGNDKERLNFFTDIRKDILLYLKAQNI